MRTAKTIHMTTRAKTATVWYDAKDYTGINGVKVIPGWVYFKANKPGSNPAVPGIYRIQVGPDGKPMGTPQTIQEGLATDDFAVAPDGSVILPSGTTLYKITTAGVQTKIADPAVTGPSAIVSNDGMTAYWGKSGCHQPTRHAAKGSVAGGPLYSISWTSTPAMASPVSVVFAAAAEFTRGPASLKSLRLPP